MSWDYRIVIERGGSEEADRYCIYDVQHPLHETGEITIFIPRGKITGETPEDLLFDLVKFISACGQPILTYNAKSNTLIQENVDDDNDVPSLLKRLIAIPPTTADILRTFLVAPLFFQEGDEEYKVFKQINTKLQKLHGLAQKSIDPCTICVEGE